MMVCVCDFRTCMHMHKSKISDGICIIIYVTAHPNTWCTRLNLFTKQRNSREGKPMAPAKGARLSICTRILTHGYTLAEINLDHISTYTYVHTYSCIHTHTCIHAWMHAYIHTWPHARDQASTNLLLKNLV